jgi:hypothetical protein
MEAEMFANDHVGMWSTADGAVRKLLLPNGRYLALIAGGLIRHQGEYRIVGTRIEYFDDEGKTGVGVFEDGVMVGASGAPLYPKDALAADDDMSTVLAVTSRVSVVPLSR